MRHSVRGWVGLLAALTLAPAAGALDITGLAITVTGTNTINEATTNGNNHREFTNSTSILQDPGASTISNVGQSLTLQTRYASVLTADREATGGTFGPYSATSDYTITFTVNNPTGATYRVDIDTLRVGALTFVDEASSPNASATLGAATGTIGGVGDAAFSLASIVSGTITTTTVQPFSQSGTTLQITDSALSRTFTLGFNWTSSTTSGRDEASIRMGIAGNAILTTTADDYPGQGSRTLANDGHFVTVATTILSVPEPEPVALIALGLVALALRARRTR